MAEYSNLVEKGNVLRELDPQCTGILLRLWPCLVPGTSDLVLLENSCSETGSKLQQPEVPLRGGER